MVAIEAKLGDGALNVKLYSMPLHKFDWAQTRSSLLGHSS